MREDAVAVVAHAEVSEDWRATEVEGADHAAPPGRAGAAPGDIGTRLPAAGAPSIALRDRVRRAHEEALLTDGQARVALGLTVDDRLPWD